MSTQQFEQNHFARIKRSLNDEMAGGTEGHHPFKKSREEKRNEYMCLRVQEKKAVQKAGEGDPGALREHPSLCLRTSSSAAILTWSRSQKI